MKRLSILLLLLLPLAAAAQVKFHQGNWASLLAEAKKQNKPFYVDFYTDWCGPCKWMTKNTFGNNDVGSFSNGNFIAYKLNAEEGEGIQLAQKYQIEGYPTVIFFDANGKVLESVIGAYGPDQFLPILRKHAKGGLRLGDASRNLNEAKAMNTASAAEKASLGALFRQQ